MLTEEDTQQREQTEPDRLLTKLGARPPRRAPQCGLGERRAAEGRNPELLPLN